MIVVDGLTALEVDLAGWTVTHAANDLSDGCDCVTIIEPVIESCKCRIHMADWLNYVQSRSPHGPLPAAVREGIGGRNGP